ncbi:type II CAAX prenyl endopeptidase Rce1 family protein [Caulobacter sp. KR2-114]|uniref:CPBP family glutamic-type intramembrane protease n=1 Tax=Caulobacter sp. KR2-114 TaxID=3400912 RepID=UPI003C0AC49B
MAAGGFAAWLSGAPRRLMVSLTTLPDLPGWGYAAGVSAATLAGMAAVGFSTGYYTLHPTLTAGLGGRLVGVLIAPGLGEEAPFRGLMIPGRDEAASPWTALIPVTLVFTAWHVVEVLTFLPAARAAFLRWDFLTCAAILGLGCGLIRWRTGSLWPAVALHWLAVTIWQTWLGGFSL